MFHLRKQHGLNQEFFEFKLLCPHVDDTDWSECSFVLNKGLVFLIFSYIGFVVLAQKGIVKGVSLS